MAAKRKKTAASDETLALDMNAGGAAAPGAGVPEAKPKVPEKIEQHYYQTTPLDSYGAVPRPEGRG